MQAGCCLWSTVVLTFHILMKFLCNEIGKFIFKSTFRGLRFWNVFHSKTKHTWFISDLLLKSLIYKSSPSISCFAKTKCRYNKTHEFNRCKVAHDSLSRTKLLIKQKSWKINWFVSDKSLPTSVQSVALGKWLSSSSNARRPRGFVRNISSRGRLSTNVMALPSTPSFWYSCCEIQKFSHQCTV